MAKKHTTRKAKPSKPPKGRGGGGGARRAAIPIQSDLGARKKVAMPLDEFGFWIGKAEKLTEQNAALMRAMNYSEDQISTMRMDAQIEEVREAEKEGTDYWIARGIESGEFFRECPDEVLRAVLRRIRRLMEQGSKPEIFEGQAYLADVVAEIIGAWSPPRKYLHEWISKALDAKGFKCEWEMLRRNTSRGMNRTLFKFAFDLLWELSDEIEHITASCGVLLSRTVTERDVARQKFDDWMKFRPRNERQKMIGTVLEREFTGWTERRADFAAFFSNAWEQMRRREHKHCADLTLPVVVEAWQNHPERRRLEERSKMKRLHPSNLREEFGKCVTAIFASMREYDELTFCAGMKELLLNRFT